MPILEPEPADANKLPRIVSYDLESPPQGRSREQQIVSSYGCTLAIQACTQLRRHTRVFALERQDGDRVQKRPHGFPYARRQVGIARQPVLDFHLRDHRNGQHHWRFLTEPRHHGLFAADEVAQHVGVEKVLHEKASSRGGSNSPR